MREEQGALRSSSSRDTPDARACLSLSNAFCPRRDVALLLAPVLVIFQHRERERFFSLFVFFLTQPDFSETPVRLCMGGLGSYCPPLCACQRQQEAYQMPERCNGWLLNGFSMSGA